MEVVGYIVSQSGGSPRVVNVETFNRIGLPTTLGTVIQIMARGPDFANEINFFAKLGSVVSDYRF
jgi:hypothetical protein